MSQDNQLKQAVLAEFAWEPKIDAAHIGVTANAGVITLTGHVDNYAQKMAAELAARRVKGVKAVAEELEVRLSFDPKRGDTEIAAGIVERLRWDVSVPRDSVQAKVEKGWVTLTGLVDWHYQHDAAADAIRSLHGVVGVTNQIRLKPRVNTATLTDDIAHALNRSWFFDTNTVKVSAEGGNIRLTGTVHTPHDRSVAAMTAWSAPGAMAVENDLVVA